MMLRRALAAMAAALLLAAPAVAQSDLATLLADRIEITGDGAITAQGTVEVFYRGVRLSASRIRYERAGEQLFIDGPITLSDGDTVTVLASSAELDADLRNGVLLGAQMVLDQELQLASPRIDRVDGRYTQLADTIATSCRVCVNRPTPLWEIRARRVIHDQETRQLYFEGAQFRLAGVPLAYLPRFRMPDPTVERASGFLFPAIRNSSLLGTGIRTPYFLTFGDHGDLLITPWLSEVTSTVETRYRQRFTFGRLTVNAAVSRDRLRDDMRGYLFAEATSRLPGEFRLAGDIEMVSDPAYLSDYGYSSKDRLDSALSLRRTRGDEDIFLQATVFRTLRGPELPIKDQVTGRLLEGRYERALPTGPLGGTAWLSLDTTALVRPSTRPVVGRDVTRLGLAADWQRGEVLGPGILASLRSGIETDFYVIDNDPTYPARIFRSTPYAALDLRWPFQRSAGGASHLIEPALNLAWSKTRGSDVPNEDSSLVDFDEGNLFSLSRYPGSDRTEDGLRAALALSYTRLDPDGWSFGTTIGRIFRNDPLTDIAPSTGLSGTSSDWLVALRLDWDDRFGVISRSLLDGHEVTRSETRLVWTGSRARLGTVYTYAEADPSDQRLRPASEWTVDAEWRINANWSSAAEWRYNVTEGGPVDAELDLRYQNECIRVDVSLSRNFASSATVTPSTEFAFGVSFGGFGDSRAYRRSCTG